MRMRTNAKILLALAAGGLLGWLGGNFEPLRLRAEPLPEKVEATPLPMASRLAANVYQQTAAEYRACCIQTYRLAERRLVELLAANPRPERPAVVMDLDETVMDNSAFQTYLLRNKLEFSEARWADYEAKRGGDVTLIPGAKEFIHKAFGLGVSVIYISNRAEEYGAATEEALMRLDVAAKRSTGGLLLRAKGGSSDKSARREAVAARYNVLMYFGDNLRDFSEAFTARKLPKDAPVSDWRKAIHERATAADRAACHWGVDWFILPNPVYGEWDNLASPDPLAVLNPPQ